MNVTHFDVAVVGAGVIGSSAAMHIAQSGKKTVLVDQAARGRRAGSSSGQSRITRLTNGDHRAQNAILRDSLRTWTQLQFVCGSPPLIKKSPVLVIGDTSDLIRGMADSLGKDGALWQTPSAVNCTYGTRYPDSSSMFVDPNGGILNVSQCLSTLQTLFEEAGGTFWDSWKVLEIRTNKDASVTLVGDNDRRINAAFLVICAGPWAARLLRLVGLAPPLRVEKVEACFWKLRDPSKRSLTFIDIDQENIFYGIEEHEYPGYMKICYHGGEEADPDRTEETDVALTRAKLLEYVKRRFGAVVHPEISFQETCLYTKTPDGNFILDRHPIHSNIFFACGFSGSGFKIAPTIGKILAGMVRGLSVSQFDLCPFSLRRFQNSAKL